MRSRIVVVDDFYETPDAVRSFALRCGFRSAGRYNYPGWQSDKAVASDALRCSFEELIGNRIRPDPRRLTWGGFRIVTGGSGSVTKVHGDSAVDWAGLVFLSPEWEAGKGTGFFRHKLTGLFGPPSDSQARELGYESADEFELQVARRDMAVPEAWDLVGQTAPIYNRLVLLRGCELYHAPLGGFGDSVDTGRLTHVFFFDEVLEDCGLKVNHLSLQTA